MGLRSPQELLRPSRLQPQPSIRFQGAQAPRLDLSPLVERAQQIDQQQLKLAQANADNEQEEFRIKAQGELALAKGMDAVEKGQMLEKKLAENYDKILQKYPTRYQPILKAQAASNLNKFRVFQVPYVSGQVNRVVDETYDVQLSNKMNFAIESSGDQELFSNQALAEVAQSLQEKARRKYGNAPEIEQYIVGKGISETVRRSVEQQLRAGNMAVASQIMQNHNDKVTPADRDKINKALRIAEQDQATREPLDMATMIMRETGDDLVAAENMARQLAPNTKVYKEVRDVIRTQFRIQKEQNERSDENIMAQLTDRVSSGGGIPSAAELNSIKDFDKRTKFIESINKSKGTLGVITDQRVRDQLLEKLSNATPEEAERINLGAYKLQLGAEDYSMLEKLKIDLAKKDADGRYKARSSDFREIRTMVNQFSRGAFPDSRSKRNQIMQLAMQEYERVRDANPNYDIAEIKKSVTNRLFREGLITEEKTKFFGLIKSKQIKVAETLDPLQGKQVHSSWQNYIDTTYGKRLDEDKRNKVLLRLIELYGEETLKRPFVKR
jgi:hypothetical protein